MVPRQDVFDQYWRFAAQRQLIFFRRMAGLPGPWTDDPILSQYKFCNAYRASDRVSQYLIKDVIYRSDQRREEDEVVFRILLFRLFNEIGTWQFLESEFGTVEWRTFDVDRFGRALEGRQDDGGKLFGGAYIMCANKAFGFDRKHMNYLSLVRHMLEDGFVAKLKAAPSFAAVFELLRGYPLIGDFMAYQIATDLNYSEVIDFDENSFTMAGPGAVRGIAKCFESTGGRSREEVIHWMVDNQEREFERLGIRFASLWGRALKAIDCQNLFCETDKYSRVAFPDLKSNRSRIKTHFRPTPGKRIEYFYPPKWGINERVLAGPPPEAGISDAPPVEPAPPAKRRSRRRDDQLRLSF